MTEAQINELAAKLFGIARHHDVDVDTSFHNGTIVLTPFHGAYTTVNGQRVVAREDDSNWMVVAGRIREALSTAEG